MPPAAGPAAGASRVRFPHLDGRASDTCRPRVRADRESYRPLDMVVVTTTNRSRRTVYDDHCGGEVQGFEYLGEWNASYGMGRGCDWPDPAAWRTHSVAIPPGATHVDTLHVNGRAYTGTWRVVLTLRDTAGAPLPEGRGISNTFRVRSGWALPARR